MGDVWAIFKKKKFRNTLTLTPIILIEEKSSALFSKRNLAKGIALKSIQGDNACQKDYILGIIGISQYRRYGRSKKSYKYYKERTGG